MNSGNPPQSDFKDSTLLRSIELEYDWVEVHYNSFLKSKPYLVRVFNYNNEYPLELRLEQKDVERLYLVLKENKYD